MSAQPITTFIKHHYRHFNAAALIDAAEGYQSATSTAAAQMLLALAGAMSTAELGLSLAEMIRRGQGARDLLHRARTSRRTSSTSVAHDHYVRIPNYRDLTPAGRGGAARAAPEPRHRHLHPGRRGDAAHRARRRRVTGTAADQAGERGFPHEFLYRVLPQRRARSSSTRSIPKDSWLMAAAREEPADVRPRLGGLDARQHLRRALHLPARSSTSDTVRTGIEYMMALADWYRQTRAEDARSASSRSAAASPATSRSASCRCSSRTCSMRRTCRAGRYFCQISDSTTSYGSYSGAVPNEKITWGKLAADDAEVHRRVRRDDRGAAHVRVRARLVGRGLTRPRSAARRRPAGRRTHQRRKATGGYSQHQSASAERS